MQTDTKELEKVIEDCTDKLIEQNKVSSDSVASLASVIEKLVETSIKLENIRNKVDGISDSFIGLKKDAEVNIAKWAVFTRISSSLAIILLGGIMMSFMVFK